MAATVMAAALLTLPLPAQATYLSEDCKTLLVLIEERIRLLEAEWKNKEVSGEEYYAELFRLKRLLWTAVYVTEASTSGKTCADLIAYFNGSTSPD